jgi:RHS repeat-associated protein
MIATLTKQPTNSFSLSARRYTDPWGVTRVGASTGPPDQRYCANLGHRQDDESGLTYKRARYYEPTTGRFVSQDPAQDGSNWFVYCSKQPTNGGDPDGTTGIPRASADIAIGLYFLLNFFRGTELSLPSLSRHVMAALGLMAIDRLDRRFAWVDKAASRYVAVMRLDRIRFGGFDSFQLRLSRDQAIIAFYAGYTLSLMMIASYLEDLANGDAD